MTSFSPPVTSHLTFPKGFLGVVVARPDAIAALDIPSSVTELCAERPSDVSVDTTEPGRKRSSWDDNNILRRANKHYALNRRGRPHL